MQIINKRIHKEWQSLHIEYPQWLIDLIDDDLNYVVTVIIVSAGSFVLGLGIGWIATVV